MLALRSFLLAERNAGKTIYPKGSEWFAALDATPRSKVRVVIFGQDPYHGEGQAHGLCFSVRDGIRLPPSLLNIFKELESDLGHMRSSHGNLQNWAEQGVLLLNSVLTVEAGHAASHQGKGWEQFTDAIIRLLNAQASPLVFILWGAYAQRKGAFIDKSRHLVITSAHPSPLSAHNGFFGSKPFSRTNDFLEKRGLIPIDWNLSTK